MAPWCLDCKIAVANASVGIDTAAAENAKK